MIAANNFSSFCLICQNMSSLNLGIETSLRQFRVHCICRYSESGVTDSLKSIISIGCTVMTTNSVREHSYRPR